MHNPLIFCFCYHTIYYFATYRTSFYSPEQDVSQLVSFPWSSSALRTLSFHSMIFFLSNDVIYKAMRHIRSMVVCHFICVMTFFSLTTKSKHYSSESSVHIGKHMIEDMQYNILDSPSISWFIMCSSGFSATTVYDHETTRIVFCNMSLFVTANQKER